MHYPGLVAEFAIEVRRAGKAVPGLDAKKRRTPELRPDSEFAKSVPENLDRRTAIGSEADRRASWPVQNDRIVVEQPLRKGQRVAANRRGLRFRPQQAALQPPDRPRVAR